MKTKNGSTLVISSTEEQRDGCGRASADTINAPHTRAEGKNVGRMWRSGDVREEERAGEIVRRRRRRRGRRTRVRRKVDKGAGRAEWRQQDGKWSRSRTGGEKRVRIRRAWPRNQRRRRIIIIVRGRRHSSGTPLRGGMSDEHPIPPRLVRSRVTRQTSPARPERGAAPTLPRTTPETRQRKSPNTPPQTPARENNNRCPAPKNKNKSPKKKTTHPPPSYTALHEPEEDARGDEPNDRSWGGGGISCFIGGKQMKWGRTEGRGGGGMAMAEGTGPETETERETGKNRGRAGKRDERGGAERRALTAREKEGRSADEGRGRRVGGGSADKCERQEGGERRAVGVNSGRMSERNEWERAGGRGEGREARGEGARSCTTRERTMEMGGGGDGGDVWGRRTGRRGAGRAGRGGVGRNDGKGIEEGRGRTGLGGRRIDEEGEGRDRIVRTREERRGTCLGRGNVRCGQRMEGRVTGRVGGALPCMSTPPPPPSRPVRARTRTCTPARPRARESAFPHASDLADPARLACDVAVQGEMGWDGSEDGMGWVISRVSGKEGRRRHEYRAAGWKWKWKDNRADMKANGVLHTQKKKPPIADRGRGKHAPSRHRAHAASRVRDRRGLALRINERLRNVPRGLRRHRHLRHGRQRRGARRRRRRLGRGGVARRQRGRADGGRGGGGARGLRDARGAGGTRRGGRRGRRGHGKAGAAAASSKPVAPTKSVATHLGREATTPSQHRTAAAAEERRTHF
ncbi:hypothetical protein B0H17DRAFT_1136393 [Mycena rosella]|uniref:Uncharacterized protein n=1 Tax=Mycena rosella TaxID=1033263 RepID=A0AAD7DAV7_MYCRO|nr:hypothetical protein B0H17DRAFT_1136393 [Mycena rosella]